MAVFRVERNKGYTVMSNHHLRNKELSLKAKGLLSQTMRNRRDVWLINTVPYKGGHFAAFPPKLAETCIKAGCPKGGVVLDPFFGSGTTGAAAKQLDRHYIRQQESIRPPRNHSHYGACKG